MKDFWVVQFWVKGMRADNKAGESPHTKVAGGLGHRKVVGGGRRTWDRISITIPFSVRFLLLWKHGFDKHSKKNTYESRSRK